LLTIGSHASGDIDGDPRYAGADDDAIAAAGQRKSWLPMIYSSHLAAFTDVLSGRHHAGVNVNAVFLRRASGDDSTRSHVRAPVSTSFLFTLL